MVYVRNLKNTKKGVKCDRTTVLGNPFYLNNERDREEVCKYFDIYIKLILKGDSTYDALDKILSKYPEAEVATTYTVPTREDFLTALNELDMTSTLLCWCYPKKCHCDSIKAYLLAKSLKTTTTTKK